MFTHDIKLRVRYAETDQMGFVYYGNYATYYELGRVESLRALGFPYKQLEEEGIWMPVVNMSAQFIGPAYYDELLTIRTIIKEQPTSKIQFLTEIFNEKQQLIHKASVDLFFMNAKTARPTRPPQALAEALKEILSNA